MDIKPRLSTYIVSALGGYFLAFLLTSFVIAASSVEALLPLIPVFLFSLIVAIPVAIISSIIGYPIFRLAFNKIHFPIFFRLVASGGLSCAVCVFIYAIGFNYTLGALDLPKAILDTTGALLVFCIVVLPCSALIYWYIEKSFDE